MTGRGIDQILPHPVNPVLYESSVRDARDYVRLAEAAKGPIPRPVEYSYPWGDALPELERAAVDARIINLETSVTISEDAWPGKRIHYRMHPDNIGCLTAARIDCCCLANNHVLDWGRAGLTETLRTLDAAGIARAGAGRSALEAAAPAVIAAPGKGRVLVFALGSTCSGVPREWGATQDRSGIRVVQDLSEHRARDIAAEIRQCKQPGDVAVASIHWGSNWGYPIPPEQIRFARRLVEGGVDLVHGHSSHHLKGAEVYRDRLILYGCGDFINDYEGIGGHESFRPDLRPMYLVRVDPNDGRLVEARWIPLQSRRLRLQHATEADTKWLCSLLNRLEAPFQARVQVESDLSLTLQWR